MFFATDVSAVSHGIQLAVAPVFLLTAVAGMIGTVAGRLARIIDRGRYLAETPPPTLAGSARLEREFHDLEKRRRLASGAITACTFAALTTCLVIVLLFLEVMGSLRIMWLVGLTFMLSTLALVISLALFLREVHLATYTVRIAQHSGQTRF